jgi:hypothetical protein
MTIAQCCLTTLNTYAQVIVYEKDNFLSIRKICRSLWKSWKSLFIGCANKYNCALSPLTCTYTMHLHKCILNNAVSFICWQQISLYIYVLYLIQVNTYKSILFPWHNRLVAGSIIWFFFCLIFAKLFRIECRLSSFQGKHLRNRLFPSSVQKQNGICRKKRERKMFPTFGQKSLNRKFDCFKNRLQEKPDILSLYPCD